MGSTHVVEELLFSIVPSILTFDFDLILGSFLTFWGPNGLFFGSGVGARTVFGSTHVVEELPITFVGTKYLILPFFYFLMVSFSL